MKLSIKELEKDDIQKIIDYWYGLSDDKLRVLGADKSKFPQPLEWKKILEAEIKKPYREKHFYYVIWLLDGISIGHSNIDQIEYGNKAFMHLHLWESVLRQKGIGYMCLTQTIPFYFNRFELKELYCEPNAKNNAPIKVLEKLGFQFIAEYEKTPNWITFYQKIRLFKMTKKQFF